MGESSVEIGAHYFDTVLGLKEHLQGRQLKKFGFRFFFSEGREDLDRAEIERIMERADSFASVSSEPVMTASP